MPGLSDLVQEGNPGASVRTTPKLTRKNTMRSVFLGEAGLKRLLLTEADIENHKDYDTEALADYFDRVRDVVIISEKSPLLVDRFLDDAIEIDIDALSGLDQHLLLRWKAASNDKRVENNGE